MSSFGKASPSSQVGGLSAPDFAQAQRDVIHFFGTRQDPNNLRSLVQIGAIVSGPPPFTRIAALRQVHGQTVVVLDRSSDACPDASLEAGDALVTSQPNLLLTIRTADCVPVLLADADGRAVGAIHAGWRGAIGGIVSKTIECLCERFPCTIDRLRAAIGPSIGVCCYEVDETVLSPLRERWPFWREVTRRQDRGKALLDLKELIARQLVSCGVSVTAVARVNRCTRCEPELFFSYRRDGPQYSTMVNGIMLTASAFPSGRQ
ncbi:MAG: peptidoglycan editing factor PgeF [Nitrospirae bacterium]|nr:MAG: peptidoglycan editing factor PgeF [Nitrospirota bacterium]